MRDLNLCAIGLFILFWDLLSSSFLYLISESSVEFGIGVKQNSIWFLLKDIIDSCLAKHNSITTKNKPLIGINLFIIKIFTTSFWNKQVETLQNSLNAGLNSTSKKRCRSFYALFCVCVSISRDNISMRNWIFLFPIFPNHKSSRGFGSRKLKLKSLLNILNFSDRNSEAYWRCRQ